jgi:hypothetical protein
MVVHTSHPSTQEEQEDQGPGQPGFQDETLFRK